MKFKHLALALGAAASLGTAAMLQATTPTTASAAYRVVKTKKYNNQYYFQKTWNKSAYMWNRSHTKVVGNLKNYPTVTYNLKSSAVLQNGRKKAVYYHIGGFTASGYKYGWVWRGYLKRGGFESAASLYEKNGVKSATSYGRLARGYDLSGEATNLESYKRFAKLPSKAQLKTVVNFINGTVSKFTGSFAQNNYRIIYRPVVLPKTMNKSSKAASVGYRIPIVVNQYNQFVGTFRAFYDAATSKDTTDDANGVLLGGTGYTLPAYSLMSRDTDLPAHIYKVAGSSLAVIGNGSSFTYVKKNAIVDMAKGPVVVNGITFSQQAPANADAGTTYRNPSATGFTEYLKVGSDWFRTLSASFSDLQTDWDDDEGNQYGSFHTGKYVFSFNQYNISGDVMKTQTSGVPPYALKWPSKSFDQNMIRNITTPENTLVK